MHVTIYSEIFKNKNFTGVEKYTSEIINNLKNDIEITLLKNKKIKIKFENVKYQNYSSSNYPFSRMINSILFPIYPKSKIIHLPSPVAPFYNKPKGTSLIITVHDLTPIKFPKLHDFKNRLYYKLFASHIIKQADRIIAISESTKEDLIRYFNVDPAIIRVIYNGFDIECKKGKLPKKYGIENDYILFVGTVEPRKNLKRLIESYIELNPKEDLVIVGASGWKNKDIYKKLNNSIKFTGYVPDNDLPLLYSNAKLFVYPSLYEGFGFPILEAMKCGVPVITSAISSMPEVGGDAAYYVDPNSNKELIGGMKELLNSDSKREGLIKKGFENIKRFSWEKCSREVINVYKEIV